MKNTQEVYPAFKAQISVIKQEVTEGIRCSRKTAEQVRLQKIYAGLSDLEVAFDFNPTISQINFENIVNNEKRRDKNSQGVTLHLAYIQNAKKECFTVVDMNLSGCQKNI